MSTLPVRRHHPRSLFPEFSELFASFPALTGLRPASDTCVMRLEDEMKDGRYLVRAGMPGVGKKEFDGRSEFSYGSFVRTVSLPAGADEDNIEATYDKGILSVSVAVSEPKPAERHVQVQSVN